MSSAMSVPTGQIPYPTPTGLSHGGSDAHLQQPELEQVLVVGVAAGAHATNPAPCLPCLDVDGRRQQTLRISSFLVLETGSSRCVTLRAGPANSGPADEAQQRGLCRNAAMAGLPSPCVSWELKPL